MIPLFIHHRTYKSFLLTVSGLLFLIILSFSLFASHTYSDDIGQSVEACDLEIDPDCYIPPTPPPIEPEPEPPYSSGGTGGSGGATYTPPLVNVITPITDAITDPIATISGGTTATEAEVVASYPADDTELFEDVPDDYWATAYIAELEALGIVEGYEDETFEPDNPITRSEIIKMGLTAFNYTILHSDNPIFLDVNLTDWYYDFINTADVNDIISSEGRDYFYPNNPSTRAEALKMLLEAFGYYSPPDLSGYTDQVVFNDVTVSDWYAPYALFASEYSIVSGYDDNTFRPNQDITRAEVSKIIVTLLELLDLCMSNSTNGTCDFSSFDFETFSSAIDFNIHFGRNRNENMIDEVNRYLATLLSVNPTSNLESILIREFGATSIDELSDIRYLVSQGMVNLDQLQIRGHLSEKILFEVWKLNDSREITSRVFSTTVSVNAFGDGHVVLPELFNERYDISVRWSPFGLRSWKRNQLLDDTLSLSFIELRVGDFNNSSTLSLADFLIFIDIFVQYIDNPGDFDLNEDGFLDLFDFAELLRSRSL